MRLSASISFMFQEVPLLARFAAARAAGFAGVEIQRLAEGDVRDMAHAARDAGVQVALINVSAGDYSSGGDGLSCVPGREREFEHAVESALSAADALSAHHVHLGPSRIPASRTRDECLRVYSNNIQYALERSRLAGTSLLVEAMNRVESPTALLADVDAAAAVLESVDNDRLGLQFDIYHSAMNGDDPLVTFMRHRARVRHVQFSDVPGRHEPGTGRLDIPAIVQAIDASGYRGWFGAEYYPHSSTAASLGWMRELKA